MKIVVKERVTLEGFTYQPGEHEVDERIGQKLIHNYEPRVTEVKPKRKRRAKAEPRGKSPAPTIVSTKKAVEK